MSTFIHFLRGQMSTLLYELGGKMSSQCSHAVLGRGQMPVGTNVRLPFLIDQFDLSYIVSQYLIT